MITPSRTTLSLVLIAAITIASLACDSDEKMELSPPPIDPAGQTPAPTEGSAQPSPTAMSAPAETSAVTDKEVLDRLYRDMAGLYWVEHKSVTWSDSKPMAQRKGVELGIV